MLENGTTNTVTTPMVHVCEMYCTCLHVYVPYFLMHSTGQRQGTEITAFTALFVAEEECVCHWRPTLNIPLPCEHAQSRRVLTMLESNEALTLKTMCARTTCT